jgi:hypothetical protein
VSRQLLLSNGSDNVRSCSAVDASTAEKKPDLITELAGRFPNATKVSIEGLLKDHVKKLPAKEAKRWAVSEAFVKAHAGSKVDAMEVD